MGRKYLIDSWVGAAEPDDYSGEQLGRRRRNGGGSQGFLFDRSTGETLPESALYTPDGKANLELFREQSPSEVDQALDYLESFILKKRHSFRKCEEALDILDDIGCDITEADFKRLHYILSGMRRQSYRDSLPDYEREQIEHDEKMVYMRANADSHPLTALSLGIQPSPHIIRRLEAQGLIPKPAPLAGIDWGNAVKTAAMWVMILVFVLKFFSV